MGNDTTFFPSEFSPPGFSPDDIALDYLEGGGTSARKNPADNNSADTAQLSAEEIVDVLVAALRGSDDEKFAALWATYAERVLEPKTGILFTLNFKMQEQLASTTDQDNIAATEDVVATVDAELLELAKKIEYELKIKRRRDKVYAYCGYSMLLVVGTFATSFSAQKALSNDDVISFLATLDPASIVITCCAAIYLYKTGKSVLAAMRSASESDKAAMQTEVQIPTVILQSEKNAAILNNGAMLLYYAFSTITSQPIVLTAVLNVAFHVTAASGFFMTAVIDIGLSYYTLYQTRKALEHQDDKIASKQEEIRKLRPTGQPEALARAEKELFVLQKERIYLDSKRRKLEKRIIIGIVAVLFIASWAFVPAIPLLATAVFVVANTTIGLTTVATILGITAWVGSMLGNFYTGWRENKRCVADVKNLEVLFKVTRQESQEERHNLKSHELLQPLMPPGAGKEYTQEAALAEKLFDARTVPSSKAQYDLERTNLPQETLFDLEAVPLNPLQALLAPEKEANSTLKEEETLFGTTSKNQNKLVEEVPQDVIPTKEKTPAQKKELSQNIAGFFDHSPATTPAISTKTTKGAPQRKSLPPEISDAQLAAGFAARIGG